MPPCLLSRSPLPLLLFLLFLFLFLFLFLSSLLPTFFSPP